jgi:hypothetical protein
VARCFQLAVQLVSALCTPGILLLLRHACTHNNQEPDFFCGRIAMEYSSTYQLTNIARRQMADALEPLFAEYDVALVIAVLLLCVVSCMYRWLALSPTDRS